MFKAHVLLLITAMLVPAGQNETKMEIGIRVHNVAHVSRHDLANAENEVSRLYASAQIELRWAAVPSSADEHLVTDFSAASCKEAGPVRELEVLLLAKAVPGLSLETLGFSLPCAKSGIRAAIYIDRCEGVTFQMPVSFNKVLAYAMAHEMGHVLLRNSEHSGTGLMRGHWDKPAWMRAATGGIQIEREEVRRMRMELAVRHGVGKDSFSHTGAALLQQLGH